MAKTCGGRGILTDRRLIEAAFPLKQVSLDSVHEKNVRHGHISTLHIWPARRPLAASRAALLATLLRDPGTTEARRELLHRMAGTVVEVPDKSGERMREETRGGIMHWGREGAASGAKPDSAGELEAFRREIREAFGGRAPRVLDPFAGGGAIPLEAMRLGCEAVASEINPVAWFILRCTLHYPRLLAGQKRTLPDFALRDREFMTAFLKAHGVKNKKALRQGLANFGHSDGVSGQFASPDSLLVKATVKADLAWQLRAWSRHVLARARKRLASRYPTYAEFEPVRRRGRARNQTPPEKRYRPKTPRLLVPNGDGEVSTLSLNEEFDSLYLENEANPRWVAKPTVAYLWARTIPCAGCRMEVPLLKTRWLCRKENKRVLLKLKVDGAGISFGIDQDASAKADATSTMTGSGATCPQCGVIATMADLRTAGRSGQLGARMIAVVVNGQQGKEYRLPTNKEVEAAEVDGQTLHNLYASVPYGLPDERIGASRPSPNSRGASGLPRYGFNSWQTVFTKRQLLALGTIIQEVRSFLPDSQKYSDGTEKYSKDWHEALTAYLSCAFSKLTDYSSALCSWHNGGEKLRATFARFALPMVWDYCEVNPLSSTSGGFSAMLEWVARNIEHCSRATSAMPAPVVEAISALDVNVDGVDLICTDPPYYDAIPYSDLMDFFHVWLRRILHGLTMEADTVFSNALGPKWDRNKQDGELVDQPSRFDSDSAVSKATYEDGMFRVFRNCHNMLNDSGRLVVVFANKQPAAWETLVSALVRAGFVVAASWPIQTEMQNKVAGGARLSSSIWLVCKKRPVTARPGWDSKVLAEMQANITERLRDFWDAGIRGPDFVWAATGPALEAFSKNPVVKQTDSPGAQLTVAEFLRHVRRMVVGFVVSRLFREEGVATEELDDPTTYYLLHRNDFGLGAAPAGACILYALSCNVSDSDLAGRLDILVRGKGNANDGENPAGASTGSQVRLKPWNRRVARNLGEPTPDGKIPPLIDCVHKLMSLWKTGEQSRVDSYLEGRGLWRNELFARVVQALIELAEVGSEERATLEYIQNHLAAHGGAPAPRQQSML